MREHFNLAEDVKDVPEVFGVTDERCEEIFEDVKKTFIETDTVAQSIDRLIDRYTKPNEFALMMFTVGFFKNQAPSIEQLLGALIGADVLE